VADLLKCLHVYSVDTDAIICCCGAVIIIHRQVGAGEVLKLATNISIISQVVALGEGVLLAEKNGIDINLAVDTMLKTAVASPALQYRGTFSMLTMRR
jgi:3-hydroxyisobutyrate dehydrogenase-like beta-hydroxyacid dehydrogenase